MSKQQTVALWLGIAVMAAMFFYPPWVFVGEAMTVNAGYLPLLAPPERRARINFPRLASQWFLVAVIAGAAIVTLKDR